MKFTVKITLTETYDREVEVEATDGKQAVKIAQDRWANNEYTNLFDCPDDSGTEFNLVEESRDPDAHRIIRTSPFSKMKVTAIVDWDGKEGEDLPGPKFEVTFTADELFHNAQCLAENEDDPLVWDFDETTFGEWFGEYLTSFTDFCLNGHTYRLQLLTK